MSSENRRAAQFAREDFHGLTMAGVERQAEQMPWGTAAEVTPIRDIDDRLLRHPGLGPITRKIQEAFFSAARGQDPRYSAWNHHVS